MVGVCKVGKYIEMSRSITFETIISRYSALVLCLDDAKKIYDDSKSVQHSRK